MHRNIGKYDDGALKNVYKLATDDKSFIYAFEPETKPQSTMWAFEDKPNPTKVVCGLKAHRSKCWPVISAKLVM